MPQPASHPTEPATRRIVISGASGFLGSALITRFRQERITIQRLRRDSRVARSDVTWNPQAGELDVAALDGAYAVVNLAGAPIAQRWTKKRKREILESRVAATALLARSIARLDPPPSVLISGSAIGIYGDRADEALDEATTRGTGFLADTASAWESATAPAQEAGIRVVLLRTGIVLNPRGGALAKLLLPFKLGLGGRIGSGAQWMSWIALEDWVSAVTFALETSVSGPLNLVAPNPVPNAEFSRTLARVLGRPAFVPIPAGVIDVVLGEMGRATLLGSQRAHPKRLIEAGFEFSLPTLEQALRAELSDAGPDELTNTIEPAYPPE